MFQHRTEPIQKAVYEQKILQKNGSDAAYDIHVGVEMVRRGLFAFMVEVGVGYKLIINTYEEHEKCNLQEMEFLGESEGMWYGMRKNSSLRQMVTTTLFKIRETGIQSRLFQLLYTKRPECSGSGGSFLSVGLIDVRPAFQFLGWGFLLALVILLFEILFSYISKKKLRGKGKPNHPKSFRSSPNGTVSCVFTNR